MSLARSEPLRRTPIKSRSDAKARTDAERTALLAEYLREGHYGCEIIPWVHLAWHSGLEPPKALVAAIRNCHGVMEGLHERRKRGATGSLTNRQNLIPACNPCNQWVEDYPILAKQIGLVVRSDSPEWEELAA